MLLVLASSNSNGEDLAAQFRMLMKDQVPTYVIANAGTPYSYDPLEDLNLRNSRILKMIHARIVDSSAEGKFVSRVIDQYNYDESKKTLILKIKEGVKYTDGSLLSPEDIAFTFKRNAFLRPNLPGVEKLAGLSTWLKKKHPLLSELEGVKIDGNKVIIKFSSHLPSPMEKFSARFGVIPVSSVDLHTGKMLKGELVPPPSAGLYKIVPSKLSNGTNINASTFVKLELIDKADKKKPNTVWIAYMSPSNIGKYKNDYHDNVVIVANEIDIEPYQLDEFRRRFNYMSGPRIMYSFLILNPNSKTFENKRVRQYFTKKYRETMLEKGYKPEGSQPTSEVLGYLPLGELNKLVPPFTANEENEILAILRTHPPAWMESTALVQEPFSDIFNATCNRLLIPLKKVSTKNFALEYKDYWEKGDISIRLGYSTVGPSDPTGDLKTVFSGIHDFLKFVTDDPKLKLLVKNLQYYDIDSHYKLNKYLFAESKFAVVSNSSRVFFMTGNQVLNDTAKRQEPIVWEFFQK